MYVGVFLGGYQGIIDPAHQGSQHLEGSSRTYSYLFNPQGSTRNDGGHEWKPTPTGFLSFAWQKSSEKAPGSKLSILCFVQPLDLMRFVCVCVCVRVWRLVIPLRCCPATGMAWKPYGKANPKRPGALDGPAGDVMDRLTVVRPRVTYMGIVMDSLYQHPTLQVTTRDFKVSKSHQRRPVGGSWYMYIIL